MALVIHMGQPGSKIHKKIDMHHSVAAAACHTASDVSPGRAFQADLHPDGQQSGRTAAYHGVLVCQQRHHLMEHGVADALSAGQQAPEGRQGTLCKSYSFLYPITPATASPAQCPGLLQARRAFASKASKPWHA